MKPLVSDGDVLAYAAQDIKWDIIIPQLCTWKGRVNTTNLDSKVGGDSASLVGKAKRPVCVIEPKSNAETTSALLDLDTSHTTCNRERKMVSGLFKPLSQVSK